MNERHFWVTRNLRVLDSLLHPQYSRIHETGLAANLAVHYWLDGIRIPCVSCSQFD